MSVLIRGSKSYFMGAQAFLLDETRDLASDWAAKHVTSNPNIKWVMGRYVEADNPNRNRQAWSYEDLRMAQPSIHHAPMNILHQPRNVVGAFVATEMIYPTEESADDNITNPYIEALGAFWKLYFPEELALVQRAHDEGSLFFSMECVADTVTFEQADGTKTQFPYKGPIHESYGALNEDSSAIRWLDKPTFLAGALIIPPAKPGWQKADIKSLSRYVAEHQDEVEALYNDVEAQVPHLDSSKVEDITLALMKGHVDEDYEELVRRNSINSDQLTNNHMMDQTDASDVSHSEGGDLVSDTTYTEDQVQEAIKTALAPLQAELTELKSKADADAVETRLEELKTQYDQEISDLKKDLDEKVIEAQAAKDNSDAVVAWLEAEAEAIKTAEEAAARKDDRVSKVKEAANFPESYIEANADRWAELADETFDALVEDYRTAAEAAKAETKTGSTETSTTATAMKTERETAADGSDRMAGVRAVLRMGREGIDPRTL